MPIIPDKVENYPLPLVKEMLSLIPFDYEKTKAFGALHDKHPKSITAKLKSLEVQTDDDGKLIYEGERPFYIPKPAYVAKTGKPVEKKSTIVEGIAALIAVEYVKLKGLDKAPKAPLEALRAAIIALSVESDDVVVEAVEVESNESE